MSEGREMPEVSYLRKCAEACRILAEFTFGTEVSDHLRALAADADYDADKEDHAAAAVAWRKFELPPDHPGLTPVNDPIRRHSTVLQFRARSAFVTKDN